MLRRRVFVFALRDRMPLDESGWSVFLHSADCPRPCDGESGCDGTIARLVQQPTEDGAPFSRATAGMMQIVDQLIERSAGSAHDAPPVTLVPGLASFAVVSTPAVGDSEVERHTQFGAAFSVLCSAVDALRLATGAPVSPLTIERVWPTYVVLDELEHGILELRGLVLVEHGRTLESSPPATPDQLAAAEQLFAAGLNGDPVENIRYWLLGARNDAHVNGDYAGAVLKAAAAAEVLIKSVGGMLIWERTEHGTGSMPSWSDPGQAVLTMKPSTVISRVLSQALGGSWSSQHEHQPVGAWRAQVARLRTAVIHNGYRPTDREVDDAIAAVNALVAHVNDRLAAQAHKFPRTAVIMVAREGLERRGAWGKVRATLQSETADWRAQYRGWSGAAGAAEDD